MRTIVSHLTISTNLLKRELNLLFSCTISLASELINANANIFFKKKDATNMWHFHDLFKPLSLLIFYVVQNEESGSGSGIPNGLRF